ncbi:GNAT family N-acetyltransferase [Actinokineospora sp.]|uniref:GNAT family N-acetyltransferase n=1 Tax=Actinokineospora sp. TaxID=1872133 RepID=UPI004037A08C
MLFPHTTSRRTVLRPAVKGDHPSFLGTLLRTGIESVRPGAAANPDLARRSNAAFIVTQRGNGDVLGFSTLFGLDPAGHIKSGVYLDPQKARLGIGSEVIYLSINYAFASFNIDQVITQTTEASFDTFGLSTSDNEGPGGMGILRDHLYFRGRNWDLHTFQIKRQEWEGQVNNTEIQRLLSAPHDWRSAPDEVLLSQCD